MTTILVSAISGLVGVSVGAFVSYFIAKKQINASVISANRQNWINSLRDCIAEYQSLVLPISTLQVIANLEEEKNSQILSRIIFLFNKIKLLINPNEEDHENLIIILNDILDKIVVSDTKKINANKISKLMENLTDLSQIILKREWERVKKGK